MMTICRVAAALALAGAAPQEKAVKVTVMVSMTPDEETLKPIREALAKLAGIRVKAEEIRLADPEDNVRNRFTKHFVIVLDDPSKLDLGHVARVVAETKVPERGDRGPWLTLVLFNPLLRLEESDVVALRDAMANVNGMAAASPGGTGGVRAEHSLWVRVDGSGAAKLSEILAALRKADLDFRLAKP